MSEKKTISFVTGSRADYGIMRRFLSLLNQDDEIELNIIATGALLNSEFGHQVDLIYEDGFTVASEIDIPIDTSSNVSVLHSMSVAQDAFARYFAERKVDILIILGDRYEMLSVAIAAAMQKIPILHIHGGEATFGNYDEFIRHAITKMSLYHFTSTEEYRKRVIQLGENPNRVFNLGALGAENCLYIDEDNVPESIKNLPIKKYFVVLFHPETLTNVDVLIQTKFLLDAISEYSIYDFVFLGTNADTHSDVIRSTIKEFIEEHRNTIYFENLHTDAYHYLLKNSIGLIGNSSSGIIEAPSLGIFTINIGDRQKGRVRGNSVIDVSCDRNEICKAMDTVLSLYKDITPVNPYLKNNSAILYYKTFKNLLDRVHNDNAEPKIFYDVCLPDSIGENDE